MGDIYKIMDEIRSHVLSLEVIQEELHKQPEYTSEKEQVTSQLNELRRTLVALAEIESAVYSHSVKELSKANPTIDAKSAEGRRLIRKAVVTTTGDALERIHSSGVSPDVDADSVKLLDSTVALVDKIKGAISPDLTTMIGRITGIENDIGKLQILVEELNRRSAYIKGKSTIPGTGLFSRLQDTIKMASRVAGTVTIRGVRHTIETFVAKDPVRKMFTGRFKNLTEDNLVLKIRHLHKDAAEKINGKMIFGSATLKTYETPRSADKPSKHSPKQPSNVTLEEPYQFISLIPTAPLSLGLPADKAFATVLQDVATQVKNKTYTFNTHDPRTYEESDSENDILFDMSGLKKKQPSYLEEAVLRLSLEYLDVIHKYLLTTQNSTRGYVAILPVSVFGMKLPTKLFHKKSEEVRFINATGDQNKKAMTELVGAYNESEDIRKHLPHIAYVHTDGIKFPIYNLSSDSERILPSNLSRIVNTLGQFYVRFARELARQPATKIGLQDTIAGNSTVSDFPNFTTSSVYSGFAESRNTVTGTEKPKRP